MLFTFSAYAQVIALKVFYIQSSVFKLCNFILTTLLVNLTIAALSVLIPVIVNVKVPKSFSRSGYRITPNCSYVINIRYLYKISYLKVNSSHGSLVIDLIVYINKPLSARIQCLFNKRVEQCCC